METKAHETRMYSAPTLFTQIPDDNLKRRPSYIMCIMYYAFRLDIDSQFGMAIGLATAKPKHSTKRAILSNMYFRRSNIVRSLVRFFFCIGIINVTHFILKNIGDDRGVGRNYCMEPPVCIYTGQVVPWLLYLCRPIWDGKTIKNSAKVDRNYVESGTILMS